MSDIYARQVDRHYAKSWSACRPSPVDSGVVSERHVALNWLTCFEDADGDEVDTPT
jgi:hypothetical protein